MEKRIHLYSDRKNPAVWLTAVCLLASAAARIAAYARLDGSVWSQVIWPTLALVWFALVMILSGRERLYKTAIPVWILGICAAWRLWPTVTGVLQHLALCVCLLFFCAAYTLIISGRFRWPWLLLPLDLIVLAAVILSHRRLMRWEMAVCRPILYVLPYYLMVLGMLLFLFALRVHTDGLYHPTWGDRADGRLIRSTPAIDRIGPYIMVNRTGANNLFSESVEITALEKYVRRKRQEGLTGFGISHVIIAAYVRTVAKYPALNRFVAGQKVYSRGEDIVLSMTVKKELSLSSPDTVIKVHLNPHDTAEDVFRKFNEKVEEAKNTPLDSSMDNTAGIMTLIPGIVLKFVVWLLKTLDYFGLVPGFLLEISPFHGSAYFTSMISLGIRPVYHHLYDFGTIPVFCAFGKKHRETELVDGTPVERKYMDLNFNLDERICDGFYYASLIKYFLRILKKPEILDLPPDTVEQDIP